MRSGKCIWSRQPAASSDLPSGQIHAVAQWPGGTARNPRTPAPVLASAFPVLAALRNKKRRLPSGGTG
ncbi:hypothetical protein, partial [Glutamicibacter sp.]|uniref:hypothetical protein n=1 Tax=Glutamicibacter sp. TaxID=1931995 RepID=UPI003D6B40CD